MKSSRNEGDFAHSLTDLMSGLAVMFLLVAAIFMVQSARATSLAKQREREQQQLAEGRKIQADELDRLKLKDTKSIERLLNLKSRLEGNQRLNDKIVLDYDPKDPLLLTISFTNENLGFAPLACEVGLAQQADLRATLGVLFIELCDTMATNDTSITQTITLEGHTDSSPPRESRCGMTVDPGCFASTSPECSRQAFENNVRLSARRAQYVFFQARDELRDNLRVGSCLDSHFVVAGRGPVSPAKGEGPLSPKNRRVEIKVRVIAAATTRESKL